MTHTRPIRLFVLLAGLALALPAPAQRGQDNQVIYELLNRLDQLEREVRQLRGDLELMRYQDRQSEGLADLEQRVQQLEQQMAGDAVPPAPDAPGFDMPDAPVLQSPPDSPQVVQPISPALPEPTGAAIARPSEPPPAPPGAAASGSARESFDRAYQLLREGRYEQAAPAFQSFLSSYPDHELAGTALYWLGESHYITREFQQAKNAFLRLGSNYPDNDRMPDAMLRLGYTYQELGDVRRARDVLEQLVQVYADTQAAELARRRLNSLR